MRGRSIRRHLTALSLAPALICCSGQIPVHAANGEPAVPSPSADRPMFPEVDVLEPNVRFWRDVFSRWGLGQVAVHDLEYPALVYEVVELPGEIEETYSEEQREFVEDLRKSWETRLLDLQTRITRGAALNDDHKQLALRITTNAGTESITGAHRRVRTQRGLRERFRRGLEIGARYDPLLREVFREAGLPEDLALLPHVESSFESSARSSAGAVGAWQFTRGAGRRYLHITSAIDERLDPVAASRGAARYLQEAYDLLGDWALAITSYNHGVEGMLRAKKRLGTDFGKIYQEYEGRTFGFASKNFYAEFMAAMEIASNAEAFFPEGLNPEPPLALDRFELQRPASPGRLARTYGVPLDELAQLNPAWSHRAVRRGLALPPGTEVWLPNGTLGRAAAQELGRAEPLQETSYVVRRGDSLWSVAEMYGTTVEHLRALNGIAPHESKIFPGQRLRVLEGEERSGTWPEALVHIVRRGETLIKIASAYGVRLKDLMAANQLTRRAIIYPGQEIHVPLVR